MDTETKPPEEDAPSAGSPERAPLVSAPAGAALVPPPGAVSPEPRTLKRNTLLSGFGVGLAYGLITYFVFRAQGNLASLAYLGLVPMVMGALPLLFTDVDQIKNYVYILFAPWLSMIGLFAALLAMLKEGALCILVLATPFWGAAVIGTLVATVVRGITLRGRKRRAAGVALMLLPFALVGLERRYMVREHEVAVASTTVVEAPADEVFDQLAIIEPIQPDEYPVGLLNRLGVPRPIAATVDKKGVGGHRVGTFERGLEFQELITAYDRPDRMTFDITVDPTQLEPTSTGRHALEGGYFRFVDATYTVARLGPERARVTLTSRYVAKSSVNAYGELWANFIIGDFQDRVLQVLAGRFARWHREGRPAAVAASSPER
jgi:hypothetical protein